MLVIVAVAALVANDVAAGSGPQRPQTAAVDMRRRRSSPPSTSRPPASTRTVAKKRSAPSSLASPPVSKEQRFHTILNAALQTMFKGHPPAGPDAWLPAIMKRSIIEARDAGRAVLQRLRDKVDRAEQTRTGRPYKLNCVISLSYMVSAGTNASFHKVVGFNVALRRVLNTRIANVAALLTDLATSSGVTLASTNLKGRRGRRFPINERDMPAATMSYPANYVAVNDSAGTYVRARSACAEDHVEWFGSVRRWTPLFYSTVQRAHADAFTTFPQCGKCHQAWARRALTDYAANQDVCGTVAQFAVDVHLLAARAHLAAARADQLMRVDRIEHIRKGQRRCVMTCAWRNNVTGADAPGYRHRSIMRR